MHVNVFPHELHCLHRINITLWLMRFPYKSNRFFWSALTGHTLILPWSFHREGYIVQRVLSSGATEKKITMLVLALHPGNIALVSPPNSTEVWSSRRARSFKGNQPCWCWPTCPWLQPNGLINQFEQFK